MRVKDIMTADPSCCTPDTSLQDVARMMVDCDCGEIPVVDSLGEMRPVGVITDRDITVRTVARGLNPLELTAADCMTSPIVSVSPDAKAEECFDLMERHQLRRVLVVGSDNRCCGIVAQADIAQHASAKETAEVVKEVSQAANG